MRGHNHLSAHVAQHALDSLNHFPTRLRRDRSDVLLFTSINEVTPMVIAESSTCSPSVP